MNKINGNENQSKKFGFYLVVLLIALISVLSTIALSLHIAQINRTPKTTDELYYNIENNPAEDSDKSIAKRLEAWDFPNFDSGLLVDAEARFLDYYYKPLPSRAEMSVGVAENFIEYFYHKIDLKDKDAVTGALINSLIITVGDGYAVYRSAEESDEFVADMSGNLVGIGVRVYKDSASESIYIDYVFENSPAKSGGLAVGDFIVAVGGARVDTVGYDEAVNRIRGEAGSEVEITVRRGGEEFPLTLTRAKVEEETVLYKNEGGIAFIEITSFKSNTAEQFAKAINLAEEDGVRGIVFDVSKNPGGYLTAIREVLSYLVPSGTKLVSFSGERETLYAYDGKGTLEEVDHVLTLPCVVISSERTASAAELFCAALRDFNEMGLISAKVVGEVTYKKGVMQSTFNLRGGATLTLTCAQYNPPSDINYDGVGVIPDVLVDNPGDYKAEAIKALEALIAK